MTILENIWDNLIEGDLIGRVDSKIVKRNQISSSACE